MYSVLIGMIGVVASGDVEIDAQNLRYVLPVIACAAFFAVYYFGVSTAPPDAAQKTNALGKFAARSFPIRR